MFAIRSQYGVVPGSQRVTLLGGMRDRLNPGPGRRGGTTTVDQYAMPCGTMESKPRRFTLTRCASLRDGP